MTATFLVKIQLDDEDDNDLQDIADDILVILDDDYEVESVAPWDRPTITGY